MRGIDCSSPRTQRHIIALIKSQPLFDFTECSPYDSPLRYTGMVYRSIVIVRAEEGWRSVRSGCFRHLYLIQDQMLFLVDILFAGWSSPAEVVGFMQNSFKCA